MNPYKFSAIAHREHDYCNPISAAKIERLLDLLPLDESSRVLDLAAGRGAVAAHHRALRLDRRRGRQELAHARPGARACAVDGALGKLHLDDIDIRDFRADPETFPPHGDARARAASPAAWRHLQPAEGVDAQRRLHPDRRGVLAHARHPDYLASSAPITTSSSIIAATCRPRRGGAHPDARGDSEPRRMGRVRVEVLPLDRALRARAAGGPDVPAMLERIRKWRDATCGGDATRSGSRSTFSTGRAAHRVGA
jgi:hypothetical protein